MNNAAKETSQLYRNNCGSFRICFGYEILGTLTIAIFQFADLYQLTLQINQSFLIAVL